MPDIFAFKDFVLNETITIPGVTGIGGSSTSKQIIVYVDMDKNSHVIDDVYSKIGTVPYGVNIRFVTTTRPTFL